MYLIFNKDNLKVVSLLDNDRQISNESSILEGMFPDRHKDLRLWHISKSIHCSPINLRLELDEDNIPSALFIGRKKIYESSKKEIEAEKQKLIDQINSQLYYQYKDKFGINITKMLSHKEFTQFKQYLVRSPYTKKEVIPSLEDGSYWLRVLPLQWRGYFNLATGYATVNRNILLRLHNYGIITQPDPFPSHPNIDVQTLKYLSRYNFLKFDSRIPKFPKVLCHTPIMDTFRGKKIIYTMMETESLQRAFVDSCNQFDEVWVPCTHNRDLFVREGVNKPVYVIPLGVNEKIYCDNSSVYNANFDKFLIPMLGDGKIKKFKFVSLFQWYSRKSPSIMIKGFIDAFTDKDDTCLIIATHAAHPHQIKEQIKGFAKSIRSSKHPSIFLCSSVIPDLDLPSFYHYCDAFVSSSRGEGFSLPHIEASCCGLPIVSCNHTGMSEYLVEDNSFVVSVDTTEVCPAELAQSCGWYQGQLFNKLGKDQIDQFSKHMRYVYENPENAKKKGEKLQKMIRNNYTWDITVSKVARRIHSII